MISMTHLAKRRARLVAQGMACAILAVACALSLGGCKDTDALREIIYDQTASIIDYDSPTKFYINDETAEETSDAVSSSETSEDAEPTDAVQNLVVYSSEPNSEGFTAKKSAFGDPADFSGIEASETVCFVVSDDPGAFDHEATVADEATQVPNEEQTPQLADTNGDSDPDGDSRDGEASDDATKSKAEKTDKGASAGGDNKVAADEKDEKGNDPAAEGDSLGPDRKKDPTRVLYDPSDPNQEPPQVASIAAFGEYAVIVQMIGGAGALAATDADTLKSEFKNVFDTSGIKKGWSDEGTAKGMNVDAIVKSGAEVILVTDSAYLEELSDKDFEKLRKAGIRTVPVFDMSCSQNIKANVATVGALLQGSEKAAYGSEAENRAADYADFHDRVVRASAAAVGGMAVDSGETIYQSSEKSDKDVEKGDERYTLLVDEYEKSAKYVGDGVADGWKPANGVAFCSAGYSTTPVSYYIQTGGLINNAAAQTTMGSAGKVPVWQFRWNIFPFASGEWTNIDVRLMKGMNFERPLLDSGLNIDEATKLGEGWGTDSFPILIATSTKIKEALVDNSKKERGLYRPYNWVEFESDTVENAVSPETSDGTPLYSCIGSASEDSPTNSMSEGSAFADAIAVTPSGLFCDWTEGTVESFLEAAWVSDEVRGGSGIDWEQEAEDFYRTFYDYSIDASRLADR